MKHTRRRKIMQKQMKNYNTMANNLHHALLNGCYKRTLGESRSNANFCLKHRDIEHLSCIISLTP